MKSWFKRHLQVFFYTLGQFSRNRLNVAMTLLALGIGFSIPLIMYSTVDSLSNIGGQWQERPQITLYLKKSINPAQIEALKVTLAGNPQLGDIQYISADDGLKEFSTSHQFDEAIALLDENPLPPVFIVFPLSTGNMSDMDALSNNLGQIEHVASAQYDFEWLQKLNALTSFMKRLVIVLACIIAIGLLLLITNTIRLEISNRKDEIDIIDQLGGTPAFIARPFLYMGFLEGLLGGATAILISAIVLKLLNGPLLRLAELYGFAFSLPLARIDISLAVLSVGGLLGWVSARFTVLNHMRELAPK
jgi:cell division transport system permease protein